MSSDYDYSDEEYYNDEDENMDGEEENSTSDIEMDAFHEDYKASGKAKLKAYEVEHDSLTQALVESLMKQDIDYVGNLCGLDREISSLLLRYFNWNKDKLIEKYMDNPTGVTDAAGITVPELPSTQPGSRSQYQSQSQGSGGANRRAPTRRPTTEPARSHRSKILERVSPPPPRDEPFICAICYDDSQKNTLSLPCSQRGQEHKFCTNCWHDYFENKIKAEAEQWITCMAEGCSIVAPDSFIRTALGEDSATWARFQELLVRHFVSCNAHLKYCPYPSCSNTVSCHSAAVKSSLNTMVPIVTCGASAAHKFCFGCNIDADHRPVICAVAKMWLQKCQDDSETANWIKSNTKECSKCQSTIEKNGGCNHMTCKKCKYEFCWVCMGPWTEHGTAWYSCNRYDEKESVNARDAQSRSRASLERYLHYYNRWANHEQSAKLSVELYAKTEKKMEEMQITSNLTWIEVQFMKKAVDEVFKCRMTLKWTYAMAYYLEKDNQKELFEDNQRDLERAVEELSELIESPIDPENISTLRQKVTDKTVYVLKRNEVVLEDTAIGFLEDRWKWNVSVPGFD